MRSLGCFEGVSGGFRGYSEVSREIRCVSIGLRVVSESFRGYQEFSEALQKGLKRFQGAQYHNVLGHNFPGRYGAFFHGITSEYADTLKV